MEEARQARSEPLYNRWKEGFQRRETNPARILRIHWFQANSMASWWPDRFLGFQQGDGQSITISGPTPILTFSQSGHRNLKCQHLSSPLHFFLIIRRAASHNNDRRIFSQQYLQYNCSLHYWTQHYSRESSQQYWPGESIGMHNNVGQHLTWVRLFDTVPNNESLAGCNLPLASQFDGDSWELREYLCTHMSPIPCTKINTTWASISSSLSTSISQCFSISHFSTQKRGFTMMEQEDSQFQWIDVDIFHKLSQLSNAQHHSSF